MTAPATPLSQRTELLLRAAPIIFVILWSTGWISARAAAPYADPLTFLAVRFAFAAAALAMIAAVFGARWPTNPRDLAHLAVSGMLMHGLYLGGVWWAISEGVPTAMSGLIAAVQPILTAWLAPWLLGETITARQWLGIAIGFVGISLTLSTGLVGITGAALEGAMVPLAVNIGAMVAVTFGTFYQKRFVATGDLRATTALQYVFAALAVGAAAPLLEDLRLVWNVQTVATMAWSVLGLSIGAIGLFMLLIRHGAVSRAATLIYLIPPAVAIETFLIFDETLSWLQMAGIAVTAVGVALAVRRAG